MPTLREGLYEIFAADATILAAMTAQRIYSESLPEGFDRPSLLYIAIDGVLDQALDGTLTGVVDARVQVEIYAETVEDVESLSTAIINLCSGYRDIAVGSSTFQLLSLTPLGIGNYLPDPQGLRYVVDYRVQFGRT